MGIMGYILGLYWGFTGIMERKMETTIVFFAETLFIPSQHPEPRALEILTQDFAPYMTRTR